MSLSDWLAEFVDVMVFLASVCVMVWRPEYVFRDMDSVNVKLIELDPVVE